MPDPIAPTGVPAEPGKTITGGSAIIVEEFGWEQWWAVNNSSLMTVRMPTESEGASSLTGPDDIPALLALTMVAGDFRQDYREMVRLALLEMPRKEAQSRLSALTSPRTQLPEELKPVGVTSLDLACAAVLALGWLGGEECAEQISAALSRGRLERAITNAGERAGSAVKDSLKATYDDLRASACLALGSIGDARYSSILVDMLTSDRSHEVRSAAAIALAMLRDPGSVSLLADRAQQEKGYFQTRAYIAAAMGMAASAPEVMPILSALGSSDKAVRIAGFWSLADMLGSAGSQDLADELHQCLFRALDAEKDVAVRRSMSLGLVLAGKAIHKDALRRCRDDEDAEVRGSFAVVLGLSGEPETVDALVEAGWANDIGGLSATYAIAMLSTGDPASIARAMIAGKQEHTNALGILSLALTLGPVALPELRKLKLTGGDDSRAYACVCPRFCGNEGLAQGVRCARDRSEVVSAMGLAFVGSTPCESSLKALTDLRRSARGEQAICLDISQSHLRTARTRLALLESVKDTRPEVRAAAATGAARCFGSAVVPEMISMVTDERSAYARRYAISALACAFPESGQDREAAIEALARVIDSDSYYECRAMATLALGLASGSQKARDAIHRASDDSRPDVVAAAAIAFGMEGHKENGKLLLEVLRKWRGTPIEEAALLGLWRWGAELGQGELTELAEKLVREEAAIPAGLAIASCCTPEDHALLLRMLQKREALTVKAVITAFTVLEGMDKKTSDAVVRELRLFDEELDENIRFSAAMARYSLGDRSGLKSALSALCSGSAVTMETALAKEVMTEIINRRIPVMRKLMPFDSSDGL